MSSVARQMTSSTDPVMASRTGAKRAIVRLGILLVALQAVFLGLLVIAQAVPDDRIVANLLEAVEDGTYASNSEPDNMGGTSSSFTECVAIGTGLGRPDLGPWERALRMPRIGNCADGPDDLRRLDRGESIGDVEEYFRYWAGWTVVTRPVLALWGLDALRRISGALLVFTGVGALLVVGRRTTPAYAVGLIIPFLLASNVMATPTSSVEQALSFSVAFVSVAATAWGATHGLEGAALGAAAGAAIYIFVEFLIAPAIPWMLSASVAGAVTFARTAQLDRTARAICVTSVVWPIAFPVHVGDTLGAGGAIPRVGSHDGCRSLEGLVPTRRRVDFREQRVRRFDQGESRLLARHHLDCVGRGAGRDRRRRCDADRRIPAAGTAGSRAVRDAGSPCAVRAACSTNCSATSPRST